MRPHMRTAGGCDAPGWSSSHKPIRPDDIWCMRLKGSPGRLRFVALETAQASMPTPPQQARRHEPTTVPDLDLALVLIALGCCKIRLYCHFRYDTPVICDIFIRSWFPLSAAFRGRVLGWWSSEIAVLCRSNPG